MSWLSLEKDKCYYLEPYTYVKEYQNARMPERKKKGNKNLGKYLKYYLDRNDIYLYFSNYWFGQKGLKFHVNMRFTEVDCSPGSAVTQNRSRKLKSKSRKTRKHRV